MKAFAIELSDEATEIVRKYFGAKTDAEVRNDLQMMVIVELYKRGILKEHNGKRKVSKDR